MSKSMMIASEVADLLRVDKQRIYELARTGKIPFTKVGERQYRFERAAIERWIDTGGNMARMKDDSESEEPLDSHKSFEILDS